MFCAMRPWERLDISKERIKIYLILHMPIIYMKSILMIEDATNDQLSH